jgi:hypothetical protein
MRVLLALLCWALVSFAQGKIMSKTTESARVVRLHYDAGVTECRSSVIIVGVGTDMSVTAYDGVGTAIAAAVGDSIVLILDAAPGKLVKYESENFANKVNQLVAQLKDESSGKIQRTLLPPQVNLCPPSKSGPRIVLGGHSASGQASFYAAVKNLYKGFTVDGFLGLDPFKIGAGTLSIPALYWGFSLETCFVKLLGAARGAYDKSTEGIRAFYQLQNDHDGTGVNQLLNGGTSKQCYFSHCCFTDAGCLGCSCPRECGSVAVHSLHHDVGVSVRLFLKAITEGMDKPGTRFSRQQFKSTDFNLTDGGDFLLYLDDNTVEATLSASGFVGVEL